MQPVKLIVRAFLVVTGTLILNSCAITPSVNPNSVVQVNQHFEIPNLKARVYIQKGIVSAKRDLDPWNTYCSLLMQDLHSAGEPRLAVSPGQFEVSKVRQYSEQQYFRANFVASAGEWHYVPPIVVFTIEMRLKSPEQPGVRALICAKQVESYGSHYPTVAEMKIALGNTIEIKSP